MSEMPEELWILHSNGENYEGTSYGPCPDSTVQETSYIRTDIFLNKMNEQHEVIMAMQEVCQNVALYEPDTPNGKLAKKYLKKAIEILIEKNETNGEKSCNTTTLRIQQ